MTEISEAARRLKELREQAGLTMRAVSEALGWSLTRYQHYEDRYKRRFLPFELARDLEAIFTPHGVESGAVLQLAGIEPGQPVNPRREVVPVRAAPAQGQRDLPVMGTVAMGERFFQPLVVLGLTIPGLMWALIAVMLFGINEFSPYFAVTVTIFPMLVINIWAGVKSLDKELIDMSHVFRFTKWMKISQVILPQLVPNIFAATRYGLGLAWKVVVVVEMFGTSNGVGYQVMKSYQVFNMEGVIAWTITFVIAMIVIEYGLINFAERRLTAWRPRVEVWRR